MTSWRAHLVNRRMRRNGRVEVRFRRRRAEEPAETNLRGRVLTGNPKMFQVGVPIPTPSHGWPSLGWG